MRFNSPAPFKSGKLVLGKYRKLDLMILAAGIGYMLIQPYGIYHNWLEYLHVLFLFSRTRKVWVSAGEYQNTGGSSIDEEVKL